MKWTKEEIEILRRHYADCDCDEMSRLLPNHTKQELNCKAYRLGLHKSEDVVYRMKVKSIANARKNITSESVQKSKESHIALVRKERLRMSYGLPRTTRLQISEYSQKMLKRINKVRHRLRTRGYIISIASFIAFYSEETSRSRLECEYVKLGFRFIRYGESQQEHVMADNNEQPFTDFYL